MPQTIETAFEITSQIAHFTFGVLIVVLADYFFKAPEFGIMLVGGWAFFKEFIYDLIQEDPTVSGGLGGSLRDFFFYFGGALSGWVLTLIHGVV